MFIIGVTGSIGSGKSTVARMLGDLIDAPVIDADSIARELVMSGREALISIVETFGNKMICEDGTLNRKKLGDLIFKNIRARKALNKIMFPLVRKRSIDYFNGYAIVGREYLIYDATLLFESHSNDLVDYTALVYVPHDIQAQRLMDRNNLTSKEAEARVDAQTSNEELLAMKMDYCIRNTSDFVGLNSMVNLLWKDIRAKRK